MFTVISNAVQIEIRCVRTVMVRHREALCQACSTSGSLHRVAVV